MPLQRCVLLNQVFFFYAWCVTVWLSSVNFTFHDITYKWMSQLYKLYTIANWMHNFYSLQKGFPILITKERLTHPPSSSILVATSIVCLRGRGYANGKHFDILRRRYSRPIETLLEPSLYPNDQLLAANDPKSGQKFETNSFNHYHGIDRLQRGIHGTYLVMFFAGIFNHIDSLFRYHQKMNRRLGTDVIEGHTLSVLVQ